MKIRSEKHYTVGNQPNDYEQNTFVCWVDYKTNVLETRPSWGHNIAPTCTKLSGYVTWLGCMHGNEPLERVKEITDWLKENIDNPWQGPIGYMGTWKFRFTAESDLLAFKLLIK